MLSLASAGSREELHAWRQRLDNYVASRFAKCMLPRLVVLLSTNMFQANAQLTLTHFLADSVWVQRYIVVVVNLFSLNSLLPLQIVNISKRFSAKQKQRWHAARGFG